MLGELQDAASASRFC